MIVHKLCSRANVIRFGDATINDVHRTITAALRPCTGMHNLHECQKSPEIPEVRRVYSGTHRVTGHFSLKSYKSLSFVLVLHSSVFLSFVKEMSEGKSCVFFRKRKRPAVRQRDDEEEKGEKSLACLVLLSMLRVNSSWKWWSIEKLYFDSFLFLTERSSDDDDTQVIRKKSKGPQGPLVQSVRCKIFF